MYKIDLSSHFAPPVLGSSTTQLLRNLASALEFGEGDELIISMVDHEANIAAWVDLAERQRLVIRWWKPESPADAGSRANPKLTPENLQGLLSAKTALVALTHASNILGTIHDVKAIADMVHTCNPKALVCVDGVAYAPHREIDVKELGVDFYAFSWYKVSSVARNLWCLWAHTRRCTGLISLCCTRAPVRWNGCDP